MKKLKPSKRNFIAKYDYLINKAKVFIDRKKEMKRGYNKHKTPFDGILI